MKVGSTFLLVAMIFLSWVEMFSGELIEKKVYYIVLSIEFDHDCELSFVSDAIELTIEVSENFYNSHNIGKCINNESKSTPDIYGTGNTKWKVIVKSKKVVIVKNKYRKE